MLGEAKQLRNISRTSIVSNYFIPLFPYQSLKKLIVSLILCKLFNINLPILLFLVKKFSANCRKTADCIHRECRNHYILALLKRVLGISALMYQTTSSCLKLNPKRTTMESNEYTLSRSDLRNTVSEPQYKKHFEPG